VATQQINCSWKENMQFEATDQVGHRVTMDIPAASGGDGAGFSPMPVMLVALGGCMGVDVKMVLNKMKVPLNHLEMEIFGDLDEDTRPRIYKKITIDFHFSGDDLSLDKLEKAIKLAEEKYCNVSAILSQTAELEYRAIID
jgi:putative redox protein